MNLFKYVLLIYLDLLIDIVPAILILAVTQLIIVKVKPSLYLIAPILGGLYAISLIIHYSIFAVSAYIDIGNINYILYLVGVVLIYSLLIIIPLLIHKLVYKNIKKTSKVNNI